MPRFAGAKLLLIYDISKYLQKKLATKSLFILPKMKDAKNISITRTLALFLPISCNDITYAAIRKVRRRHCRAHRLPPRLIIRATESGRGLGVDDKALRMFFHSHRGYVDTPLHPIIYRFAVHFLFTSSVILFVFCSMPGSSETSATLSARRDWWPLV